MFLTWSGDREEEAKEDSDREEDQSEPLSVGGDWKNVFNVHWVRRLTCHSSTHLHNVFVWYD